MCQPRFFQLIFFSFLFFTFVSCEKDPIEPEPPILPPTEIKDTLTTLYSYYVAGHTYGQGTENIGFHPPFKAAFNYLNAQDFEFGIFTGDMVPQFTQQDWDEFDADVALLNMPLHYAVGNHDVGFPGSRAFFEKNYGRTYYHFKQNGDLFFILDPNIDQWNISGKQLTYLQEVIENNYQSVDNIFVFFHQVLWWSPDNIYQNIELNSLQNRADDINFWTEVMPIFENKPNNVMMFAGDLGAHYLATPFMYHQPTNNITFIGSGMGYGQQDNIVEVHVLEDKTIELKLIALNGDDKDALGKLEDYLLP